MIENPIAQLYYGPLHWDFRLGNYLALLRTMAIAPMVCRLYEGSALKEQTFLRLKRTRELLATLVVEGVESDRAQQALFKINQAHRKVEASNDEYKYVLSVFFLEPLRWNRLHGARLMRPEEAKRLHAFWMQVGAKMGITDLFSNIEQWQDFQRDFENKQLGPTREGQMLAQASLFEVVRLVIPSGMQEVTRQALLGTMEVRVRDTLHLRKAWMPIWLSLGVLRLLAYFGAGRRVPTMSD